MNKISLAEDTIDSNELEALSQWIVQGHRLTKGPLCLEFEKEFSKWQGAKYAIFVNSGSSANLLIAQALIEGKFLKNKTVIIPSVSWVTTATPFIQLGYDVKLCDCDKDNLGLDVEHFEELCIKYNPAAVMIVHVLGHANKMKEINTICKKYNVLLLEDACEALGSTYNGIKLGSLGLTGSFSFYYGHHISTIEGGMIVTDDTELYNIMLSIRSHGWGRDVSKEVHTKWKADYDIDEIRDLYTFYYLGYNLRSTDLNAYIGISQLKKIDHIVNHRLQNFILYKNQLSDYWCQKSDTERLSSFAYGVLVENRLEVFRHLKANGIETRPLICGNLGRHPFWIKKYGICNLRNADIVHDHGLYLPNHLNISEKEICCISNEFKKIAKPFEGRN